MSAILKTSSIQCFVASRNAVGGGELVTNGDRSGMGIVRYESDGDFAADGVQTAVSGYCRCLLDDVGELNPMQTVKIGDNTVFVKQPKKDAAGALMMFDFDSTSPATGDLY